MNRGKRGFLAGLQLQSPDPVPSLSQLPRFQFALDTQKMVLVSECVWLALPTSITEMFGLVTLPQKMCVSD